MSKHYLHFIDPSLSHGMRRKVADGFGWTLILHPSVAGFLVASTAIVEKSGGGSQDSATTLQGCPEAGL